MAAEYLYTTSVTNRFYLYLDNTSTEAGFTMRTMRPYFTEIGARQDTILN